MMPVALIVGTHGLRGFLKLDLRTDFPERLAQGNQVMLEGVWRTVTETTIHKDRLMIKLDRVNNRTDAELLRGKMLEVVEARPELESGEYLLPDLIGSEVFDSGASIGRVTDVLSLPAQDILVVGETLIPFVKEFVRAVDVPSKKIEVALIPGMRTDSESA